MLMSFFKIRELPELLDATDALAVAMCHHYQNRSEKKKKSSWESFAKDNPRRIKN
jgi:crossover junction endodeoxyribonuclease RuvC